MRVPVLTFESVKFLRGRRLMSSQGRGTVNQAMYRPHCHPTGRITHLQEGP